MRFADDARTALRINDRVTLAGIPAEAHAYRVNGRTPLEWLIDRYRIVRDKESGITNDPNAWFADPRDLLPAIRRVVHVSAETARIVAALPESLAADEPTLLAPRPPSGPEAQGQPHMVALGAQPREGQEFVDAIYDRSHE